MANITIELPPCSSLEQATREKALKAMAKLPLDDLERLRQIADNPKARQQLKSKWAMLKAMFS